MHRRALALALIGTAVGTAFFTGGCELFNTTDDENAAGRGPKAFDPYAGAASGALRLGLQMYNSCAILAGGEPVGKGGANIPYPSACPRGEYQTPEPPVNPAPPMPLEAGATYFLNQITIEEGVKGLLTDPSNMGAVTQWMSTQTRFQALDWSGVGVIRDEFVQSDETPDPDVYQHEVEFGNAAWMLVTDDSFLMELLDVDGNVKQSFTYDRSDFLAQNATAGHTRFIWTNANIGRQQFPGDITPHAPPDPGPNFAPVSPIAYRTQARLDMITSTHPTKSFKLDPGLIGDGAIRLTWSQMPSDPFYFPVTFVKPTDLPATCYDANDQTKMVACDFGLEPEVQLAPPANGQYYMPGDQLQVRVAIKDGSGNYLHPLDHLPTYNQMLAGQANGLLYISFFGLLDLGERDSIMTLAVSGPHQNMRPQYELDNPSWYANWEFFGTELSGANALPGQRDLPINTAQVFTLPANAQPGTYSIVFKTHRQYLGERFTKATHFDFQVGQTQPTNFPGRVGNCQICHRGVITLENVRHGLPVDFVEGCKTCHNRIDPSQDNIASQAVIHRVHMNSPKYPQPKNDCTMCHITQESATRPSYFVCSSCHPQPHGTMFWELPFQNDFNSANTGVWSNCAQQCHGQTPPTAHILPAL